MLHGYRKETWQNIEVRVFALKFMELRTPNTSEEITPWIVRRMVTNEDGFVLGGLFRYLRLTW